jgi:hypothetical protein
MISSVWSWHNSGEASDQLSRSLFRVEMEMQDDDGTSYGTLLLVKNQAVSPVNGYTLKRIEQLKRSIVKGLQGIAQEKRLPLAAGMLAVNTRQPLLVVGDEELNKVDN